MENLPKSLQKGNTDKKNNGYVVCTWNIHGSAGKKDKDGGRDIYGWVDTACVRIVQCALQVYTNQPPLASKNTYVVFAHSAHEQTDVRLICLYYLLVFLSLSVAGKILPAFDDKLSTFSNGDINDWFLSGFSFYKFKN